LKNYLGSINQINFREGGERFLIPATWFREWCDFANFDISALEIKS
jgi:hypothetical protein